MSDARIEVDYRATGDIGERKFADARKGLQQYNDGLRQTEQAARDADRSVGKLAESAARSDKMSRNEYMRSRRGFSGASGDYVGAIMAQAGTPDEVTLRNTRNQMNAMRRFYELQQGQSPSAVRTRDILDTVRSQQSEAMRRASRPNVSLASINESYRRQERVEQARARQTRFDAIQDQQSQESRERADRASRLSAGDRFRRIEASERHAAERRAMFAPREVALSDIGGLSSGDPERRLTPNGPRPPRDPSRFRFDPISGAASASRLLMGGGAVAGGLMLGHKMMSANNEFLERADSTATDYDTLARSMQIQAGFKDGETTAARRRVDAFAYRAALDKDFSYATATQLISSGFTPTEATGPAMQEMLKGVNAMPAPGGRRVDPVQLAEAAASYMTSQNMDKTGANLRNVLAGVQQLYKSTNFQLADFTELAGQADTMRGKLTMGEQFGAFSVLRDVGKTAEESTTALRNIAIRSQTTYGSPEKTAALESLGLKSEDIDMQGESFITVLDRLAKAIEGKDSAKVTTALQDVFGERTLAGILRLIEDRGKVKERAEAVGDVSQYEADAATMSSGPAAAKRRQQLQSEQFAIEHSEKDDLLRQELKQQALERGEGSFAAWGRGAVNWTLRGLGVGRDTAAAMSFESFGGGGRLSEAKRTLAEKGALIDPAISNPLREQAIRDLRENHPGLKPSDPFDRTGKGTIGQPTNVIPRHDAEIRAENERFAQEQEDKRNAGALAPRSPVGGQQQADREDMLRQIRDAIREQKPVVVIKGNGRNAPVSFPLMMLGAGPMTGIR